MYITTSRNPSKETKEFSKTLCFFLGVYGKYENRGKKSIEDIINRAKKLGNSEILIISETNRKPSSILKIKIFGKKWSWKGEIKFKGYKEKNEKEKIKKEKEHEEFEVLVCDDLKNFFEIENPITDSFSKIVYDKKNKKIKFIYKGKSLILNKVVIN
jgi:rRNA maturation protein Rpf1